MNIIMDTQKPVWAVFQDKSKEFRWLEKDGKLILQVSCPYQNETSGGFEWRDVPIVKEQEK